MPEKENGIVVYMLQCIDGTLYTGWTNHLEKRLAAHNAGRGAKYTRSRRPVHLVYQEAQPDRSAALRREAEIKRLTRLQKLALIPGTSRSGATILGGILLGASRTVSAEFTFFLAIPVMFGASFLKMVKFGFTYTGMEIAILLTGLIVAFVVSVLAIKFLMGYIKKHDFKAFGYYRIILGALVLLYFLVFANG